MNKSEVLKSKTVILRGVGGCYGYIVKVDVIDFDESQQVIRVKLKNESIMDFSIINEWEHLQQKMYSTYQLDVSHLKDYESEIWMRKRLDNVG